MRKKLGEAQELQLLAAEAVQVRQVVSQGRQALLGDVLGHCVDGQVLLQEKSLCKKLGVSQVRQLVVVVPLQVRQEASQLRHNLAGEVTAT